MKLSQHEEAIGHEVTPHKGLVTGLGQESPTRNARASGQENHHYSQ